MFLLNLISVFPKLKHFLAYKMKLITLTSFIYGLSLCHAEDAWEIYFHHPRSSVNDQRIASGQDATDCQELESSPLNFQTIRESQVWSH